MHNIQSQGEANFQACKLVLIPHFQRRLQRFPQFVSCRLPGLKDAASSQGGAVSRLQSSSALAPPQQRLQSLVPPPPPMADELASTAQGPARPWWPPQFVDVPPPRPASVVPTPPAPTPPTKRLHEPCPDAAAEAAGPSKLPATSVEPVDSGFAKGPLLLFPGAAHHASWDMLVFRTLCDQAMCMHVCIYVRTCMYA